MVNVERTRILDLMDRLGAFTTPEGSNALGDLRAEVNQLLKHLTALEDELYYTRREIGFKPL